MTVWSEFTNQFIMENVQYCHNEACKNITEKLQKITKIRTKCLIRHMCINDVYVGNFEKASKTRQMSFLNINFLLMEQHVPFPADEINIDLNLD